MLAVYAPLNYGATKMKYKQIVPQVRSILGQYESRMTLRQIFYRLVSKQLIKNLENRYKGLSRMLVKARELGEIDWRRMEDRTRRTHGGDFEDMKETGYCKREEELFRNAWKKFTLSQWKPQPKHLEVWLEKDALSGLVTDFANALQVKTCPTKGYSSYTYIREAVERLNEHKDKELIVLYLGDYDPSGDDITRDLGNRLRKYGADVTVELIALNLDQIQKYNLPPEIAKTTDPRYAKFVYKTGSTDTVELDALEPNVLQEIIETAIKSHIDMDLWQARIEERAQIRARLWEKFGKLVIEWGE